MGRNDNATTVGALQIEIERFKELSSENEERAEWYSEHCAKLLQFAIATEKSEDLKSQKKSTEKLEAENERKFELEEQINILTVAVQSDSKFDLDTNSNINNCLFEYQTTEKTLNLCDKVMMMIMKMLLYCRSRLDYNYNWK